MPRVGSKKFNYSPSGRRAAAAAAKKTGKKVTYTKKAKTVKSAARKRSAY